jgi:hypothetical protein
VYMGPDAVKDDVDLRRWVVASLEFVDSQPPKPAKLRRR